jgi:hypothetical protein
MAFYHEAYKDFFEKFLTQQEIMDYEKFIKKIEHEKIIYVFGQYKWKKLPDIPGQKTEYEVEIPALPTSLPLSQAYVEGAFPETSYIPTKEEIELYEKVDKLTDKLRITSLSKADRYFEKLGFELHLKEKKA